MINIVLRKTGEQIDAFEVKGHANSGPYGYDLVCAGVSAITFGAVNALMELCNIQPVIQREDSGYLYVELPPDFRHEGNAQTILKAMVVSLQTIEQEYEQFIQIICN